MKGCCILLATIDDKQLQCTYHQKIVSTSPLVGVDLEREAQEVTEHWRQGMFLLDRRCAVGRDEPQCTEWTFIQVRRLALDHLDGHDTQRPDVNLSAVLLASDNLGGHPVGGTYHGRALVVAFVDLRAETEIGCEMC